MRREYCNTHFVKRRYYRSLKRGPRSTLSAVATCKVHASTSATPDCRAVYGHQHLQGTVAAPMMVKLMQERGEQKEVEGRCLIAARRKLEAPSRWSSWAGGALRAALASTHFISLLPNFCSNTTRYPSLLSLTIACFSRALLSYLEAYFVSL